jgi:glycosyltransferase involved in cell wall biosynthesis
MSFLLWNKKRQRILPGFYVFLNHDTLKKSPNSTHKDIELDEREEKVAFTFATIPSLSATCNNLTKLMADNPSWNFKIILFDLHLSSGTIWKVHSLSKKYKIIPIYQFLYECKINFFDLQMQYDYSIIRRLLTLVYIDHVFKKGVEKAFYISNLNNSSDSSVTLDELFENFSMEDISIKNGFIIFFDKNKIIHKDIPGKSNTEAFVGLHRTFISRVLLQLWMREIRRDSWFHIAIKSNEIGLKTDLRLLFNFMISVVETRRERESFLVFFSLMKIAGQLLFNTFFYLFRNGINFFQRKLRQLCSPVINPDMLHKIPVLYRSVNEQDSSDAFTIIPLYNIPIDSIIQRLYAWTNISRIHDASAEEKILQLMKEANKEVLNNHSLNKYWYEVYRYQDNLKKKFPDILNNVHSRSMYQSWIDQSGSSEYESSFIVTGKDSKKTTIEFGITLFGFFLNIFGIAEIGRAMACALLSSSIPVSMCPLFTGQHEALNNSDSLHFFKGNFFFTEKSYQINIFMVNADSTPATMQSYEKDFFLGKYIIGCWFWEIEGYFPFEEAFEYVDEIWGFSDFCCNIYREYSPKPVYKITYPFYETWNVIMDSHAVRTALGIDPESVTFFFNFDFHSCIDRKNPYGIIETFSKAFCNGFEKVTLVIKSLHAEFYPDDATRLAEAVQTDSRIIWKNQPMTKDELISVMNASDCYISLHRSEGFGIGMMEAMYLGKCVIATAYGGNMDFMDNTNSFLIDYSYTEVQKDFGPYKKGCKWADPYLDQVILIMKDFYQNHEKLSIKFGKKASKDIREKYDPMRTTGDILKRVCAINLKDRT